jgi:hypothetical protein
MAEHPRALMQRPVSIGRLKKSTFIYSTHISERPVFYLKVPTLRPLVFLITKSARRRSI